MTTDLEPGAACEASGGGSLSVEPVSVHFVSSVVLTGEGNDPTAQEG